MIRTNLSTRPFYNERAVRGWLVAIAVVAAVATTYNVARVIRYSNSDVLLGTRASSDEARTADLRIRAARLRASVDTKQIDNASIEARQANDLIDRRTFSWTELFNRFETTLPDNVRITAVKPKVDAKKGFLLTIVVLARSVEDVNRFMDNLEDTGAFAGVSASEEHFDEQGLLIAQLEARVRPRGREEVTTLLRRIIVEKRSVLLGLVLTLVANIAVYVLVVYPLGVKSANAANRAEAASEAVKLAEQDFAAAQALVTSKTRAEQELLTFYDKVVPGSESLARRMTYTALPDLASKANVKWLDRRTGRELQQKLGRLGQLHIVMVLQGDYQNVRRFIYELETAPLFVIIDDVTLAQSDPAKPPTLTLEMSTYYRLGADGN